MRKGIRDPKVDKIQKKVPKEDKRRKKEREIKSHGGHPKSKKYKKGEKGKKREGATLLSFISHLCFRVAPVLQFVESFHVVLA